MPICYVGRRLAPDLAYLPRPWFDLVGLTHSQLHQEAATSYTDLSQTYTHHQQSQTMPLNGITIW